MNRRSRDWSLPALGLVLALLGAAVAAACGSSGKDNGGSTVSGGSGGSGADGGNTGGTAGISMGGASGNGGSGGSVTSNYPCTGCQPFPPDNAPACSPTALGNPTVAYPPDGVLLPPNMNVLEVQFVPPTGATLFEVDFTNKVTHVTVETKCNAITPVRGGASTGCAVTLPQGAWTDIANHNRDGDPVKVTVRATKDGKCATTSTDQISINFAKEDLAGGIYYWQSAVYGGIGGKTGGIYSHDFGTFDPTPVPFYTSGATGTCVGCHNLSRDGLRMSLAIDDPDADDELGDVHTLMMEVDTRNVFGSGKNLSPGFQTWTHDHSQLIASTFKNHKNTAFDVLDGASGAVLGSDTLPNNMAATQPDLSKDDQHLVFVVPGAGTIDKAGDHHFFNGALYMASYDTSTHAIGTPSSILSSATASYYYPSFSPNGTFLVFDEAPPDEDVFWNRKARVKLLQLASGSSATPIDLPKLNKSSKIANSWPRWSPFVTTYKGHKLLWVTFSSDRDYGLRLKNTGFDHCYPPESPAYDQPQPLSKQGVGYDTCAQPQIWMAAIIVDDGKYAGDRSFPAFWLPFQDVNSHNFCAQWVEKLYSPPPPSQDGGGCGTSGSPCGASQKGCCSDMVCCAGSCQPSCIQ